MTILKSLKGGTMRLTWVKFVPGQLSQVGVDDLILRAVGISPTDVEPGPVTDGLDDADMVSAVVVPALPLRNAVSDIGGLHINGVSLAIC